MKKNKNKNKKNKHDSAEWDEQPPALLLRPEVGRRVSTGIESESVWVFTLTRTFPST